MSAWPPSGRALLGRQRSFAGRRVGEGVAEIRARAMVPGDLFQVALIEREAFARPGARQRFETELGLPQSRSRVAELEGAVLGYLIYWKVTDEFQILDIAVKQEFRRRGVAGKLLEGLLDEADALLGSTVHLEVATKNAGARGLYAAYGFAEVGHRENYYGPGEDALLLARESG